jgi:hypothetical protein
MTNTEIYNDPIHINGTIDEQGHVTIRELNWEGQPYTIVAIGRQWDETDGRYVMAEAADGTRFELQLRREDLIWHVKRVWRVQMAA